MAKSDPKLSERLALVHATGLPMSAADDKRVGESIAATLKSLDDAVKGSLFDTEPAAFDVTMRRLAKGGSK